LLGAWCITEVKKGTLFGPFKGEIVKENQRKRIDFRYAWEVYDLETNELAHIVSATDPSKGDWTRYVNCARYLEEQNLVSVQEGMQVYYKAIRDIPAGEELLTWFERSKIKENKVIEKSPEKQNKDKLSEKPGKEKSPEKQNKGKSPEKLNKDKSPEKQGKGKSPEKQNKDVSPKKKGKRTKSDSSLGLGSDEAIGEKRQRKKKKLYGDEEVSFSKLIPKKRGRKLSDPTGLHLDTVIKEDPTDSSAKLEKASAEKPEKVVKKRGPKKGWKKEKGEKGGLKKKEGEKEKMSGPVKEKLSKEDEEKLAEIEKNWKFPPRHNEYQFDIWGHFGIVMNNKRMYKCDICTCIYRQTFSLKRHYLRNHINCSYLNKSDMSNCMIAYSAQYLALLKNNSNSVMDKVTKRLKAPKQKTSNEISKSAETVVIKKENENSESATCSVTIKDNDIAGTAIFPGLYRCNVCNKLFDEKMNLMTHTKDHPLEGMDRLHQCSSCSLTFRFKMNLVRHQQIHEKEDVRKQKKIDKLKMKNEKPLNYSGDPEKPFGCSECNMKFRYKTNLTKHENIHAEMRPCICPSCGKSFPTSTVLKKHMHVHTKVQCKNCDSVFGHVLTYRKHVRITHPEAHIEHLKKLLAKRGKLSARSMALLEKADGKMSQEEESNQKKEEDSAEVIEKNAQEIHEVVKKEIEESVIAVKKKRGRKPMSLWKSGKMKVKRKSESEDTEWKEERTEEEKSNSAEERSEAENKTEDSIAGKEHKIEESSAEKREVDQQGKKDKKTKKKIEDGIDSRFKFSCVVCKKRFTEYLNMCRHRRVAHENPEKLKYECGLSNKNGEKVKNSETNEVVQESPEEVAAFYATVAYNIAENLNCYLDGGQDAVANCKSLIKTTDEVEVEEKNDEKEEIIWEQYNFPHNYDISALSDNFEYDPTDPDKEKQVCKPKVNYFEIDENSLDDRSPAQCLRRRGSRESREDRHKRNSSWGHSSSRDNSSSRDAYRDDSLSRDVDRDDSLSRDVDRNDSLSRDVDRDDSLSRDTDKNDSFSRDVDQVNSLSQDVGRDDSLSGDVDQANSSSQDAERDNSLSRDVDRTDSLSQDVDQANSSSQDTERDDSLSRDVDQANSSSQDTERDDSLSQDVSRDNSSRQDVDRDDSLSQDVDQDNSSRQHVDRDDSLSQDVDREDYASLVTDGSSRDVQQGESSNQRSLDENFKPSQDGLCQDAIQSDITKQDSHDSLIQCVDESSKLEGIVESSSGVRDVIPDENSRRDVNEYGISSRDGKQLNGFTLEFQQAEDPIQNSNENEDVTSSDIEQYGCLNKEDGQTSNLNLNERDNLSNIDQNGDSMRQNVDADCAPCQDGNIEVSSEDPEQSRSNKDRIDFDTVEKVQNDENELLSGSLNTCKESEEMKTGESGRKENMAGLSDNKQVHCDLEECEVIRTIKLENKTSDILHENEEDLGIAGRDNELVSERDRSKSVHSESIDGKELYGKDSSQFNSLLEKDKSDHVKVIKAEDSNENTSDGKCIMGQKEQDMMGNQRECSNGSVGSDTEDVIKSQGNLECSVGAKTADGCVEIITIATLGTTEIKEEAIEEPEISADVNASQSYSLDNKENFCVVTNTCQTGDTLDHVISNDKPSIDSEKHFLDEKSGKLVQEKNYFEKLGTTDEGCDSKHSGDADKSEESSCARNLTSHPYQETEGNDTSTRKLEDNDQGLDLKKTNFEFSILKSAVEKKITESGSITSSEEDVMMVDLFTDSDSNSNLDLNVQKFSSSDPKSSAVLFRRLCLSKGKLTQEEEEKKGDGLQTGNADNYDAIKFGSLGDPVYVCSVCKRHYPDFDGLMRHQWKKHPSINCHFMEVEQGLDIEDLFYSEPCSRGILGTTGKALENVMSKASYTCTRCKGSFKSPDRLRVHIVNCATPSPSPKKKKYYYYKRKTPTKQDGVEEDSPSKKVNLKELNAKLKQLSDDMDQADKKKKIAGKNYLNEDLGKKAKTSDGSTKLKDKKETSGKEYKISQEEKKQPLNLLKTPEKKGNVGKVAVEKNCTSSDAKNKKTEDLFLFDSEFIMGEFTRGRRKKMANQMYNPRNHIRRRELTEVLDTHQCKGCGVKFKSISLLERHVKKCDGKEKFKDLEVIKSHVNEVFHQKHKHSCMYCGRNFTYPKTLMNHLKAFCAVKKEKTKKGVLAQVEMKEEARVMGLLKQQEENRKFSEEMDMEETMIIPRKKGGWPKGTKRKKIKRKNHAWTTIKRKRSGKTVSCTEQIEDSLVENDDTFMIEGEDAEKLEDHSGDDLKSESVENHPKVHGDSENTLETIGGQKSELMKVETDGESGNDFNPFNLKRYPSSKSKSKKYDEDFFPISHMKSFPESPSKPLAKTTSVSLGSLPAESDKSQLSSCEAKSSPCNDSISKSPTKSPKLSTLSGKSPLKGDKTFENMKNEAKSPLKCNPKSPTKEDSKLPSKDSTVSLTKSATKSPSKYDGTLSLKGAIKDKKSENNSPLKRKIDCSEKDAYKDSEMDEIEKKKQKVSKNNTGFPDANVGNCSTTKIDTGETKQECRMTSASSEGETKKGKSTANAAFANNITSVLLNQEGKCVSPKSNFQEGVSAQSSGKPTKVNEMKRKSHVIHNVNHALCSGGQSAVVETAANASFNVLASAEQTMSNSTVTSDNSNKKLTFHMYDGSSFVRSKEKEMKLKSYDSKFHVLEEKDFAKKLASKSSGKSARKLTELSPIKGEDSCATNKESNSSNQVQSNKKPVQINKNQSCEKVVKMSSVVKRKPDKFVFHSANFEKK
ncbi:hypothetical protein FSP39_001651, partial [Pinctada imbricata]